MTSEDDDLFRQAMGDVKPITVAERVAVKKIDDLDVALEHRRKAAADEAQALDDSLSGDYQNPVAPHDIMSFKRAGIQHGVFKNLRLGKYGIEARLDLHRQTVEQSRVAVLGFVKECCEHDVRCALITHGKGENRQPQPALLKSCVAHWLPQLDAVLAFHSAMKQHGGAGATYVLFKKSEKKRQENLERHQKKRPY